MSELTDREWRRIAGLIPDRSGSGGRGFPPVPRRAIVEAILYRQRTGTPWRKLPKEFPAWSTVASYYRNWRRDGIWREIEETLA